MKRGTRPCVGCHPIEVSNPSVALAAYTATLSWPRLEQYTKRPSGDPSNRPSTKKTNVMHDVHASVARCSCERCVMREPRSLRLTTIAKTNEPLRGVRRPKGREAQGSKDDQGRNDRVVFGLHKTKRHRLGPGDCARTSAGSRLPTICSALSGTKRTPASDCRTVAICECTALKKSGLANPRSSPEWGNFVEPHKPDGSTVA